MTARFQDLRDPRIDRGAAIGFRFDGQYVQGFAGESVAAALHASGIRILRESPRAGAPRGAFCWMGLCQECTVIVEGVRRPACRTQISEGLAVLPGTIL